MERPPQITRLPITGWGALDHRGLPLTGQWNLKIFFACGVPGGVIAANSVATLSAEASGPQLHHTAHPLHVQAKVQAGARLGSSPCSKTFKLGLR